jgi:predicted metalloprotease with PDZ domain
MQVNIFSRTINSYKPLYAFLLLAFFAITYTATAQRNKPVLQYTVSILAEPSGHYYHVQLDSHNWDKDTVILKMPQWMPGYYQLMNYAKSVGNFSASDNTGKNILLKRINDNTWQIVIAKNKSFRISYDVKTEIQFVANSYLDSNHAYIIPAALFLYADGYLNTPVQVSLKGSKLWNKVATGLEPIAGKPNEYTAPNFDILYDCPILAGNLQSLPSFKVNGIEHRFIAYKPGRFDEALFMQKLQKVVETAVAVIGDIPYKQYTFIGIGPGRGGIEHLNNTTVSFDGSKLNTESGMNSMMNFLAHEYFHHYNVKRIRPFELGPFDYDKENKTNLLWISEGLSVYYEYMVVKRSGIVNEQTLFTDFEKSIEVFENNTGRLYQSLAQASYQTWSDGPFGKQGEAAGKSISYYDKGPAVGLILDFAIRHATENKKSLDGVMRLLYWQYYKKLGRGFTDAEFQQACETVAGISLTPVFEYVYTTKELDYNTYLAYAGLRMDEQTDTEKKSRHFAIKRIENPNELQTAILKSWLGE